MENNSWLIWQLADSAFPSGGFAHSGGLEAVWQNGEIRDSAELASFIEANIWQTAFGMIPFVNAAHQSPEKLAQWDDLCDAFLSNHVANRASRVQGRAFLNSASRIFGLATTTAAAHLEFAHFAPVFGAVTRALAVKQSTAAELFLFQTLRGLAAAAIRLGIVGPLEGQALQHRLSPHCREMLVLTDGRTPEDAAAVAPLLEIWQGGQDRLYSRLFQS